MHGLIKMQSHQIQMDKGLSKYRRSKMNDLPDRFPRGWFVLGHQRDFPVGEVNTIYGFDRKIQVERLEDRTIRLDFGDDEAWPVLELSLIHISEPTRLGMISYAVFCLKKKNQTLYQIK